MMHMKIKHGYKKQPSKEKFTILQCNAICNINLSNNIFRILVAYINTEKTFLTNEDFFRGSFSNHYMK